MPGTPAGRPALPAKSLLFSRGHRLDCWGLPVTGHLPSPLGAQPWGRFETALGCFSNKDSLFDTHIPLILSVAWPGNRAWSEEQLAKCSVDEWRRRP